MKNWYNNAMAYKIKDKLDINKDTLNNKLKDKQIKHCGPQDMISIGWEPLLSEDETTYCLKISEAYLMSLVIEEKDIPASVVKEELTKKINKIEKEEQRKVKGSEKKDMKENIIAMMKPNAFVKTKRITGYIDTKNKKLIVNTSSAKNADTFTSELRGAIDELPISIFGEDVDVMFKLNELLRKEEEPDKFAFGNECVMKSMDEEGSTITAKNQDLFSEEIERHIESNKMLTEVELVWQGRIRFKINQKFDIKSIKPLDIVEETLQDDLGESDDHYSILSAEYLLMVEDFNELLENLIKI